MKKKITHKIVYTMQKTSQNGKNLHFCNISVTIQYNFHEQYFYIVYSLHNLRLLHSPSRVLYFIFLICYIKKIKIQSQSFIKLFRKKKSMGPRGYHRHFFIYGKHLSFEQQQYLQPYRF